MRQWTRYHDKAVGKLMAAEQKIRARLEAERERDIVHAAQVNRGDPDFTIGVMYERFANTGAANVRAVLRRAGIKWDAEGMFI